MASRHGEDPHRAGLRLQRTILATAVEDERIAVNPCRIKGGVAALLEQPDPVLDGSHHGTGSAPIRVGDARVACV